MFETVQSDSYTALYFSYWSDSKKCFLVYSKFFAKDQKLFLRQVAWLNFVFSLKKCTSQAAAFIEI